VSGVNIRAFDPAAMHLLLIYGWPGNVRELRNTIERAVVIADGDVIRIVDLPERVRAVQEIPDASSPSSDKPDHESTLQPDSIEPLPGDSLEEGLEINEEDLPEGAFRTSMRKYETLLVLAALRAAGGNQTEAAKRLELPRRTFQHKMKLLGIRRLGYSALNPPRGS
jgi:DNA-binding NtrC family response regulator